MTDLIEHFITARSTIDGDRPRTVARLRRVCALWQTFLADRGNALDRARPEDLLAFIANRQEAGVADTTIRGELCVIRTFYAHHLSLGKIPWSPAASLPQMICNPPAEKDHLTVEECIAVLGNLDTSDPVGLRNYVIIALLWSTGLRNRELVSLTWRDIDLDDGALLVREGKGGKQRHIFLNDRVTADLRVYRERTGAGADDHLFQGAEVGTALSSSRLVEIVRQCAALAGIDKPVNPMTFRHTFATHMFEAGVAIDDLKELMGHADPTETTIYVHVSLDAAKQLVNDHAANPLKYR